MNRNMGEFMVCERLMQCELMQADGINEKVHWMEIIRAHWTASESSIGQHSAWLNSIALHRTSVEPSLALVTNERITKWTNIEERKF